MKWKDTPFDTLTQAHKMAKRLGLKPTGICTSEEGGFKYFQCLAAKRTTTIVAQQLEEETGLLVGPVREVEVPDDQRLPLQDPSARSFSDEDRFRVGPWCRSSHASLEEAIKHFKRQFHNPGDIQQLDLVCLKTDNLEYEYLETSSGTILCRVLERLT